LCWVVYGAIERATRSRADAMTAVNGQKRHQHGKPSYRQRKGIPSAFQSGDHFEFADATQGRFMR